MLSDKDSDISIDDQMPYQPYLPRCHVSPMRSLVGLLAEESNVGICFHPGHVHFITHQVQIVLKCVACTGVGQGYKSQKMLDDAAV